MHSIQTAAPQSSVKFLNRRRYPVADKFMKEVIRHAQPTSARSRGAMRRRSRSPGKRGPVMAARPSNERDEMRVFLVILELAGSSPELPQGVIAALEDYADRAPLWDCAWLVKTTGQAGDVLEALDAHLDEDDRIFVTAASGETAWRNVQCDFVWLKENLEGIRLED